MVSPARLPLGVPACLSTAIAAVRVIGVVVPSVAEAGAFMVVIEGVMESIADQITAAIACPTIGIGASARCDGQVLVAEDMLGLFERTPRFVKRYGDMAGFISETAGAYAAEVRARTFPTEDQVYRPKK